MDVYRVVSVMTIISSILIISFNVLALLVLLAAPSMRTKPLYLLLIGLVCCDLFTGAFVVPMHIRAHFTQRWHACAVSLAVQVTANWLTVFVSGWTLVTQNIIVVSRHTKLCVPARRPAWYPQWAWSALVVGWPWLAGGILGVAVCIRYRYEHSIYRNTQLEHIDGQDTLCMLMVEGGALIYLWVVCFMLPVILLQVFTSILMFTNCRTDRSSGGMILLVESHSAPFVTDSPEHTKPPPADTLAHEGQHTLPTDGHCAPRNASDHPPHSKNTSQNGAVEDPNIEEANTCHSLLPNTIKNGVTNASKMSDETNPSDMTSQGEELVTQGHEAGAEDIATEDWRKRLVVPNCVFTICVVPVMCWVFFQQFGHPYPFSWEVFQQLQIASTMLWYGRSYLLPISWLSFRHIRKEVTTDFKRIIASVRSMVQHQPPSTDTAVTFSRLDGNQEA